MVNKFEEIEENLGEVLRELNERIGNIEEISMEGNLSSFMAGRIAGLIEALTIVELYCGHVFRNRKRDKNE